MSVPREGIHKWRIPIIDLALLDVLGTFIAAYFIVKFTEKKIKINKVILWFIILFLIGQIIHKYLNIETQFLKWLK
jgi:hypothetical protein